MIPATRARAFRRAASFVRQKIVATGGFSTTSTSPVKATGWSADATFPGVVADHGIEVQGAGAATVSAYIYVSGAYGMSLSTIQLRRNGSVVDSGSIARNSGDTLTWTGECAQGDRFEVWVASGNAGQSRTVTSATWIELVPTA